MAINTIIFADDQIDDSNHEEVIRTPISTYQRLQINLNYEAALTRSHLKLEAVSAHKQADQDDDNLQYVEN